MARPRAFADTTPFGWVEISEAGLQRLRRELEQRGQGVVDEMGVLTIHAGYADYFFPGTSVLQTRPRYLFFVCWNFLWLARQRNVTAANLLKRKDEAELWVTGQLVATSKRSQEREADPPNMDGIIGVRVFNEEQSRLPAQRVDFIFWTALKRWGFYKSRLAPDRARLFRRWRGATIRRVGEGGDESEDDAIPREPLAEIVVPPLPDHWCNEEWPGLDFELSHEEAKWLQERLMALDDAAEGSRLLAKAAELCAELPPRMVPGEESGLRPWDDPLAVRAAKACGQRDRLERASQASQLVHYVRAIYGALVEWIVEETSALRRDPPLRHYRDQLRGLVEDKIKRDAALALALDDLYADVPRIPKLLRVCLRHVQDGLLQIASGADVEDVFMNDATHRLFEAVERNRKGGRARLPRTGQAAIRRDGFDPRTVGVYGLDYRWNRVRYLLWDLHRGLARA